MAEGNGGPGPRSDPSDFSPTDNFPPLALSSRLAMLRIKETHKRGWGTRASCAQFEAAS